jgi:hypothetical protein
MVMICLPFLTFLLCWWYKCSRIVSLDSVACGSGEAQPIPSSETCVACAPGTHDLMLLFRCIDVLSYIYCLCHTH